MAAKVHNLRRTILESLLSACAVMVVFVTVVASDGRVREEVAARMSADRARTEFGLATGHAQTYAAIVMEVAKDQSRSNAPMMAFLVAATILTVFMIRT